MSQEFWMGVLVSTILFTIGILTSIFAQDIRHTLMAWRQNRALRGKAQKIDRLERELSTHEHLANNPGIAAAFFWENLFRLIQVFMLSGLIVLVAFSFNTPVLSKIAYSVVLIILTITFGLVGALINKANHLNWPQAHSKELRGKINNISSGANGD